MAVFEESSADLLHVDKPLQDQEVKALPRSSFLEVGGDDKMHTVSAVSGAQLAEEEDENEVEETLPICANSIVAKACKDIKNNHLTTIAWQDLASLLSATPSATAKFRDAVGLGQGEMKDSIKCSTLCQTVAAYVGKRTKLPPSSNVGCYKTYMGVNCSVQLGGKRINRIMAHAGTSKGADFQHSVKQKEQPGEIPKDNKSESKLRMSKENVRSFSKSKNKVPYKPWDFAIRVAMAFRFYPAEHEVKVFHTKSEVVKGVVKGGVPQAKSVEVVAKLVTQAKAWVNRVIMKMKRRQTLKFRKKWFGGFAAHPWSVKRVRQQILLALNFVVRELDNTIYVVPASAKKCEGTTGGGIMGFVFKANRQSSDPPAPQYMVTKFPRCKKEIKPSEFEAKECGLTSEGNFIVFLCKRWYDWPRISHDPTDSTRIGTIVHELIHHTGPQDKSYDEKKMRNMLSQAEQLNNAASYQRLVWDVATSGGRAGKSIKKCPSNGKCAFDKTCTCSGKFKKISKALRSGKTCYACKKPSKCPSNGSCLPDATCTCSAKLKKMHQTTPTGAKCYYCKKPAKCPSDGRCTTDKSCLCSSQLKRSTTTLGSGAKCYSCQKPVSENSRSGSSKDSEQQSSSGSVQDSQGSSSDKSSNGFGGDKQRDAAANSNGGDLPHGLGGDKQAGGEKDNNQAGGEKAGGESQSSAARRHHEASVATVQCPDDIMSKGQCSSNKNCKCDQGFAFTTKTKDDGSKCYYCKDTWVG